MLGYNPSEVFFNQWQNYMLIIGWEAEPVFSEVMSMRYLVDAVERSAHLVCVSSRYATLCAKAKRQVLLNPIKQLSFMNSLLEPEHTDPLVVELKKAMHLVKTLLLVGTDLLASPFRNQVLNILYRLKRRFGVDYSFVGDLMPLPAKELRELVDSIEDYDSFVFFETVGPASAGGQGKNKREVFGAFHLISKLDFPVFYPCGGQCQLF